MAGIILKNSLKKQLKVVLSFSRVFSNKEESYFLFSVEDYTSGIRIGEIKIPESELGNLFGNSHAEGTGIFFNNFNDFGKKLEIKSISFNIKKYFRNLIDFDYETAKNDILKEYPDWTIRRFEPNNHHLTKNDSTLVTLQRFIDIKE